MSSTYCPQRERKQSRDKYLSRSRSGGKSSFSLKVTAPAKLASSSPLEHSADNAMSITSRSWLNDDVPKESENSINAIFKRGMKATFNTVRGRSGSMGLADTPTDDDEDVFFQLNLSSAKRSDDATPPSLQSATPPSARPVPAVAPESLLRGSSTHRLKKSSRKSAPKTMRVKETDREDAFTESQVAFAEALMRGASKK